MNYAVFSGNNPISEVYFVCYYYKVLQCFILENTDCHFSPFHLGIHFYYLPKSTESEHSHIQVTQNRFITDKYQGTVEAKNALQTSPLRLNEAARWMKSCLCTAGTTEISLPWVLYSRGNMIQWTEALKDMLFLRWNGIEIGLFQPAPPFLMMLHP